MYQFDMRAIEPGDNHVVRAKSEAEVVRLAVERLRNIRNEPNIGPATVEAIKTRLTEAV
ncbi:MAG: DUF1059 domain-containing protein [Pseudomonadota bacterium]